MSTYHEGEEVVLHRDCGVLHDAGDILVVDMVFEEAQTLRITSADGCNGVYVMFDEVRKIDNVFTQ